jgi:hypothetical protein
MECLSAITGIPNGCAELHLSLALRFAIECFGDLVVSGSVLLDELGL